VGRLSRPNVSESGENAMNCPYFDENWLIVRSKIDAPAIN
jgi:hypothetical protein